MRKPLFNTSKGRVGNIIRGVEMTLNFKLKKVKVDMITWFEFCTGVYQLSLISPLLSSAAKGQHFENKLIKKCNSFKSPVILSNNFHRAAKFYQLLSTCRANTIILGYCCFSPCHLPKGQKPFLIIYLIKNDEMILKSKI